jgi:hypothetical protein
MKTLWDQLNVPVLIEGFQWYQEHNKRYYSLWDLNVTNKENKQTTFKK